MPTQEPNWQPISMLGTIAELVDGMLMDTTGQLRLLEQALPKPHVLDDATLDQVERTYRESLEHCEVFAEQARRWEELELDEAHRRQVDALAETVQALQVAVGRVLEVAGELRQGTIDRVMDKSDLELGLEALLHGVPREP